jgi:formylglycine-generating enzyme required for sulfatase activity
MRSPGRRSALAIIALCVLAACSLITGADDLTATRADGGYASSEAAAAVADALAAPDGERADAPTANDAGVDADVCPFGVGPSMVSLSSLQGTKFCIDATEVTQAQYAKFLIAVGSDAAPQASFCAFNDSYAPTSCGPGIFDPTTKGDHPVVCVDWCDARAFCAWSRYFT